MRMRMRMRGFLQSHRRGIASLNYADIEGEMPTSGFITPPRFLSGLCFMGASS